MRPDIEHALHFEDCIVVGCRLPDGHEGEHDFSVGPFPQEPAFGSEAAVAQAAETIRTLDFHGHTPGPWSADGSTEKGRRYHQIDHQNHHVGGGPIDAWAVATVCDTLSRHESISAEEDAANARLIAAAPDLLAERDRLLIDRKIAQAEHEQYRRMAEEVAAKLRAQRDALEAEVEQFRRGVESWKAEEESWKKREAELLAEVERLRVLAVAAEALLKDRDGRKVAAFVPVLWGGDGPEAVGWIGADTLRDALRLAGRLPEEVES